jgi:hypothetical protein
VLEIRGRVGAREHLRLDRVSVEAAQRVADAFHDRHGAPGLPHAADDGADLLPGDEVDGLIAE